MTSQEKPVQLRKALLALAGWLRRISHTATTRPVEQMNDRCLRVVSDAKACRDKAAREDLILSVGMDSDILIAAADRGIRVTPD